MKLPFPMKKVPGKDLSIFIKHPIIQWIGDSKFLRKAKLKFFLSLMMMLK
jgi:hypothetical protein